MVSQMDDKAAGTRTAGANAPASVNSGNNGSPIAATRCQPDLTGAGNPNAS